MEKRNVPDRYHVNNIRKCCRIRIIFQNEFALFAYQLLKYPMVCICYSRKIPIIIIDEAQDTSVNQMAVFDLLSKSGVKSMFLVGDADQSYMNGEMQSGCFYKK